MSVQKKTWHGLHTLSAVPRLIQPYTLCRAGRFLPVGGKNVFSMEKGEGAKIVFARKNQAKFLPAKIDFAT